MVEVARLTLAGSVGQTDHAGARLFVGASLIEAYLALFAHADDQQVQVAGHFIEIGAVIT